MKKIISIVLLLTLCLGLFAGCTEPAEPTSDLANAKALLFSKYKPASKDEIPAKSADFEVVTSVLVDGVSYPVEWTVAVTSGAADAVKIVDGSSAAFKKIDLTEKPESEIQFTLTAVIKDSKGNSETLEFKFKTPAFEAPTAEKVVIKIVADNKYATGTEYEYTSSSGNVKMELNLSENKAEALPLTMINNADGTVSFKTDCGKFLFCDANSVEYVSEESDYTKFVLEAADGGYFIKCAVANYNGNPQYLEVYSGYLTCYSMNESSNLALYIFALEDATGAAGTVVEHTPTEKPEDPEKPEEPEKPSTSVTTTVVDTPVAGTAYKFGMVQGNLNKTFYLVGGMDGYYMDTTEDATKAIDVYLEATEGGYYLYTMVDGVKNYINMVVSGTHVNGVYETTASTVYTYDAEKKTIVADVTVGDKAAEPYWFGTRNDKTFDTVGPCAVSYNGFYCQFYTVSEGETPAAPTTTVVDTPVAGTAYKFGMVQGNLNKTFYLVGGMDGYYMDTTEDATKAIDVYLEATEGGYYLYTMVEGVKTYINMVVSGTHVNGVYETTASTVYTYDAEKKTIVADVTVGDKAAEPYWFGTRNDKTFDTVGPCAVSYNGFYCQFYTVSDGTTTEPEKPAEPSKPADATITFDDAANRTVMTTEQQVWAQNGITVTNDKAASTSDVKDYTAPVRFYANTSLKIEFTGMKTIKIYCNRDNDVQNLLDSLPAGVTATSDGKVVTITLSAAADALVIEKLVAQIRVDKIEIFK